MKIMVIFRSHGGATVKGVFDAASFDAAVRLAYPTTQGHRVVKDLAPNHWVVHTQRADNVVVRRMVWCKRATDADIARYPLTVAV